VATLQRSAHLAQLGDTTSVNPLGDEDVARGVETRVVWVEKPTGDPAFAIRAAAELHIVLEYLLAPRGIFAEMRDHQIVFIEQRDARAQIGHKQDISARIDVRG